MRRKVTTPVHRQTTERPRLPGSLDPPALGYQKRITRVWETVKYSVCVGVCAGAKSLLLPNSYTNMHVLTRRPLVCTPTSVRQQQAADRHGAHPHNSPAARGSNCYIRKSKLPSAARLDIWIEIEALAATAGGRTSPSRPSKPARLKMQASYAQPPFSFRPVGRSLERCGCRVLYVGSAAQIMQASAPERRPRMQAALQCM